MNLTELLADAKIRAKEKKRGRKKATPAEAIFRSTKEEIRKIALEQCIPESLHLRLTEQTCTCCGAEYTSQNNVPLVKRVSKSLTHFEATTTEQYSELPRVIEIRRINIPSCESCFQPADITYLEEPKDVTDSKPAI